MKREFSAGGIVFNAEGEVLLIQAGSMKDRAIKQWKFPKGNINRGESSRDAAIREIWEETGVQAEIMNKLGDSKYVYPLNGERIFKIVTIYLMAYRSGEVKPQEDEVEQVGWFTVEEALKILSFSSDKALLKKALEFKDGQ